MIFPPLRRVLIMAFIFFGILVLVMHYYFELQRIEQYKAAIREQQAVLQQKQNSVRDYQEKVDFYGTDEGIEHLAREQYNLTTSGDRVILLQK